MSYKTVVDANGRKYGLRKLTPVDTLDVLEAAGDQSSNAVWVQMALMMCAVESIGDVDIPMPASKAHIRALAAEIGDVGFSAIQEAMFPRHPPAETKINVFGKQSDAAPELTQTEQIAKN